MRSTFLPFANVALKNHTVDNGNDDEKEINKMNGFIAPFKQTNIPIIQRFGAAAFFFDNSFIISAIYIHKLTSKISTLHACNLCAVYNCEKRDVSVRSLSHSRLKEKAIFIILHELSIVRRMTIRFTHTHTHKIAKNKKL